MESTITTSTNTGSRPWGRRAADLSALLAFYARGTDPAGCRRQMQLEQVLLSALPAAEHPDRRGAPASLLGVRAATARPGCLHLRLDPQAVGPLLHRLLPRLEEGRLLGAPGLRWTPAPRPDRITLAGPEGHGHLVLHLEHATLADSEQWEHDLRDLFPAAGGAIAQGGPVRLHQYRELHPLEEQALRPGAPTAGGAGAHAYSRALRDALTGLPEVEQDLLGHDPAVLLGGLGATRANPRRLLPTATGPADAEYTAQAEQRLRDLAEAAVQRPPWAASCAGQRRLERVLLKSFAQHDIWGEPGEIFSITGALAGPSCLHLALAAYGGPLTYSALIPRIGSTGLFTGVPGLRRVGRDPARLELAAWNGHGRVVLHLDAEGTDYWRESESDEQASGFVDCPDGCPPRRCPAAAAADETPLSSSGPPTVVEHPLEHLPAPHPLELAALAAGTDPAADALASLELRRALAQLPAPHLRHDCGTTPLPLTPPPSRRADPTPAAPPPAAPAPAAAPRPPRPLAPAAFHRTDALSTEQLAEAVTRQLLHLLDSDQAQPGDLLLEPAAILHTVGGPRTTGRTANVLNRAAQRYGLVRHRPAPPADHPDDGDNSGRTLMVWEVSPAAPALAATVRAELPPP